MEEAEKDEYELLEAIGSGSFGVIRKVRRKADGRILARKEIDYRKMSTQEKEQLVAEVNILKDLKHPNIVEFLERVIDRENCFIYILMEYCEGGDLASVIQRHKENRVPIPEEFVWELMTQLIMALHECHYGVIVDPETKKTTPRPILHRDLKPDNVFLDAKKNVKLGDFGLSRTLNNPQKAFAQTYVGTPYYMSPAAISCRHVAAVNSENQAGKRQGTTQLILSGAEPDHQGDVAGGYLLNLTASAAR
ncbi:Serine/threonine-protein kinase Nek2 [Podila minutissima]|nr:Serine/threonine-protein kinase Nek2 [Podila minutissima]